MMPQVFDDNLPNGWSCAATSDGRIYFLDDNTKETSWLHPVKGTSVQSGYYPSQDIPIGWERGISHDGIPFYIDHNNRQTTFVHPLTGKSEAAPETIQCSSPIPFRNDTSFSSTISAGHEHRRQPNKKINVGSWVKGPFLRGPNPATVTHKGWLYKQGSDGLQLWKRRWFVLSEYCLYYYKGPEEDKVLGYIPLPSFRICPPAPEDRVFRRHVFKAEHANTRSYFFAAETKDKMTQWMNSLSLASILQRDTSFEEKQITAIKEQSDPPSLSSVNSSISPTNPSTENSDSGFDGYNKRYNLSEFSVKKDVEQQRIPSEFHSFDEESEESRSKLECLNTSVDSFIISRPGSRQPFYANAPPKPRRLNTSYESPTPEQEIVPHPKVIYTKGKFVSSARKQQPYPKDRRTPEAYGATSISLTKDDYEDVYGDKQDFVNRKKSKRISQSSLQSNDRHLLEELNSISNTPDRHEKCSYKKYDEDIVNCKYPARPHSADFLEYDFKYGADSMWNNNSKGETITANHLDIRPKSSVGYHDGDFWSEENYAAKMRESAIYNSFLKSVGNQRNRTPQVDGYHQSRIPPAGAASPENFRSQTNFSPVNSIHSYKSDGAAVKNSQHIPIASNMETDVLNRSQSFLRSASARLPRNTAHNETLNSSITEEYPESDKKREESMKRLLEWKQRMLQSPLNRKSSSRPESSASSTTSSSKHNLYHDANLNKSKDITHFEDSKKVESTGTQQNFPHNYNIVESGLIRNEVDSFSPMDPRLLQKRPAPQGESRPAESFINPHPVMNGQSIIVLARNSTKNVQPESYYENICDNIEDKDSSNEKGIHLQLHESKLKNSFELENEDFATNENEMKFGHDYVNLNNDEEYVNSNAEGKIRAEPVFIDEHTSYIQNSGSGDDNFSKCNGNLYATRDPFYVTDVQMPAKHGERKTNAKRNLSDEFDLRKNNIDLSYQNTIFYSSENEFESRSKELNHNLEGGMPYFRPDQVNILDKMIKNDENNSLEKYSDSGYDTLLQDKQNKLEKRNIRRENNDRLWLEEGKKGDYKLTNFNKEYRDTWLPEKFDKSWTNVESRSKLDESDVVKEYSYEYITHEKNEELSNSQLSISLKKSRSNLASLESPKIVQETQHATNTNLVKDKIKSFSSLSENAKLAVKELADVGSEYHRKCMDSSKENLDDHTNSINTDGYINNSSDTIAPNFATSTKTTIVANQAEVKLLHDSNENVKTFSSDLNLTEENKNVQLYPSKIRNFIFNDGQNKLIEKASLEKQMEDDINSKNCVRDLLKSFEDKYDGRSNRIMPSANLVKNVINTNQDQYIEESNEHEELLPPPPVSFLEEIRANNLPIFTSKDIDEPPERPPKNFITRNSQLSKLNGLFTPSSNNLDNMYERINADNDLPILSAANDGPPKECAPPPPTTPQNKINKDSTSIPVKEDDYLPMTPTRIPFAGVTFNGGLSSSSSSLSSKHMSTPEPNFCLNEFRRTEIEEHTYIEMPGEQSIHGNSASCNININHKSKSDEVKNGPESPRYYEIGEKDGQHYEYISKQGSHYESIYMEVKNITKESNGDDKKPEVPAKPVNLLNKKNICKKSASDSTLACGGKLKSNYLLSEGSSDADDEAYKDLDSIVPPRKPRFSLSDTFRPASYYLSGVDPSIDPDGHDSSDSDLVSPPPIPIGLAPIVETPNEGKPNISNAQISSSRRNSNESQKSKNSESDRSIKREEKSPVAKFSTRFDRDKRKPISEHFSVQNIEEDSYILGSEDVYPISISYPDDIGGSLSPISTPYSQRKHSQHESDVSLLAEDGCSISVRSTSALSLSLPYHSRNNSFQSNKFEEDKLSSRSIQGDYNFADQVLGKIYRSPNYELNPVSDNKNTRFHESSENLSKSPSTSQLGGRMSRCSSSTSVPISHIQDFNGEDFYPIQQEIFSPPFHQRSQSELSNCSVNSPQNTVALPPNNSYHMRELSASSAGSESSPRTAPYYYSDVIREEDMLLLDASLASYPARYNQLNNQRELYGNKRQDIGRKVNPITLEQTSPESIQKEIKTSFNFFDDKSIGMPDERNVYESDTLRRLRTNTLTSDLNQSKNIYPYGLSLKTDDYLEQPKIIHRRTRSLEGILDESVLSRWKTERDNLLNSDSRSVNNIPDREFTHSQVSQTLTTNIAPENNSFNSQTSTRSVLNTKDNSREQGYTLNNSVTSLDNNKYCIKQSIHTNYIQAREENWEDDGEWRDKLRRASLRHTKSLETLDDPRRSCLNSTTSVTNRHKPTLALLDECTNEISLENQEKSLDEYHVDYREGRLSQRPSLGESNGRTRKGMSSLDKYEWDTAEERFKMPVSSSSYFMNNDNSNKAFLGKSLPASSVVNRDVGQKIPPQELEKIINHPQDYTQGNDENKTEDNGRLERSNTSILLNRQHNTKIIWKDDDASEIHRNDAPDVIPSTYIAKFGEAFPRRLEHNHTNASDTNSNYGFSQTYMSQNRNYDPNVINQYKKDDLHYSSRPQPPQYPYDQEIYRDHTYQNYRNYPNDTFETVKASPYQSSPINSTDYQNYYNQYRNLDYNYDYNYIRNSDNDYSNSDIPYHQYSDSDISVSRRQNSDPVTDLYEPQGLLGGVSAGELLGKTHEELVLLLIQLRRHQSALLAARKHTSLEKESQERLLHLDPDRGEEHFTRISYLEEHLLDLEKQYQMGKPLINLVDNMVKLGSLYRGFDSKVSPETEQIPFGPQDSLEFSRRILERRILDEDRSKFDAVAPNQNDLEEKVMQLYKLERKLGEESLRIQDLQRKKEMLERTLYDLHRYSYRSKDSAMEVERRSRQRDHMERELSRLRSYLAVSARRLEETAVENNRLEHEMMMLRQKIQSNMVRNQNRLSLGTDESQHIESEMLRVQSLLVELQKRRMELSHQIQRLTSSQETNTNESFSPIGSSPTQNLKKRTHSTWMETDLDLMVTKDRAMDDIELFTSGSFIPSYARLASHADNYNDFPKSLDHKENLYTTTNNLPTRININRNLDNNYESTKNLDISENRFNNNNNIQYNQRSSDFLRDDFSEKKAYEAGLITELDRNSEGNKPDGEEQVPTTVHIDITEADDRTKRFYGLLPKEKALEPKTVRVVKRESTERKRDRFPSSKKEVTLSYVDEDDSDNSDDTPDSMPGYSSKTASLPRSYGRKAYERVNMTRSSTNNSSVSRPNNLPLRSRPNSWKSRNEDDCNNSLSDNEQKDSVSARKLQESPNSSQGDLPIPTMFKSAAAQEIVKEMTWEAEKHKRSVPKEKRRHFTISSSEPVTLEVGRVKDEGARSRDDCDMVRALRPRNHPDVVKSTLSTRDVRINESTIDTLFGAPNKICIPERYKPDEDDERVLTATERLHREQKANSIRKMLAESSASMTKNENDGNNAEVKIKSVADKKERERMLSMNQLLAKQVMEKSRMVAARAARENSDISSSSDDLSSEDHIPTIQQRENLLV